MIKASLAELLSRIPGEPSAQWPRGERYAQGFSRGSMSVGYYAPIAADPQKPHRRDEIYIVNTGSGEIVIGGERSPFTAGDVFFVAAGVAHRFENFTPDFGTWVVFWGPE